MLLKYVEVAGTLTLFLWAKVMLKCRQYGQAVPLTGGRRPSRDRIPTPFFKDREAEHPKKVIQLV